LPESILHPTVSEYNIYNFLISSNNFSTYIRNGNDFKTTLSSEMFCHDIFQNSSSYTTVKPNCNSADAWRARLEHTQTHNPAKKTI